MKQYKCIVCGYTTEAESKPEICPVCGADHESFDEVAAEKE